MRPENRHDDSPEARAAGRGGHIVARREVVDVGGVLYREQWQLDEPLSGPYDPEARKEIDTAWELSRREVRTHETRAMRQRLRDAIPGIMRKETLSGQDILSILVDAGVLSADAAEERGWTPPAEQGR